MVKLAIYRPAFEDIGVDAGVKPSSQVDAKVEVGAQLATQKPLSLHKPFCEELQEEVEEELSVSSPGLQAYKRNHEHSLLILKRARIIARNRQCPSCRAVKITLWDDAVSNPISINNSLNILFHCECCHTSWRD
jgi:hypothetical protein